MSDNQRRRAGIANVEGLNHRYTGCCRPKTKRTAVRDVHVITTADCLIGSQIRNHNLRLISNHLDTYGIGIDIAHRQIAQRDRQGA